VHTQRRFRKIIKNHSIPLISILLIAKTPLQTASAASSVIAPDSYSHILNYSDDYVISSGETINSNSAKNDTLSINDPNLTLYGPVESVSLHNYGIINNGFNTHNLAAVSFFTKDGKLDNSGNISGWDFSVIMAGGKSAIVNNGQIIANNGVALLSFADETALLNNGVIQGYTSAIDAENSTRVRITNLGNITSQQQPAVILHSDSQLSNAGVIASQNAPALLVTGSGNAITLSNHSALNGGSNIALMSQGEANHLILEGDGSENGNFFADTAQHGLSAITSTASSRWALNGDVASWGASDDVMTIAGQLQLAGHAVIAGGGGATVQPGGLLQLMNGGTLTGNLVNNGEISVNPGNNLHGNPFVIKGNYTGNANSQLTFSGALAGDNSALSSLVINGNTAGNSQVAVINTGGNGAQTQQGITLIKINGTSAADAFVQKGRIVAGSYEYFLQQGTPNAANDQSWYLRSSLPPAAPIVMPMAAPQTSAILRPEVGAYAANMAASNTLFIHRLQDRLTATAAGSSMWLRQTGTQQRAQAGSQLTDRSNQYMVQMGADLLTLQTSEQSALHLGVMAGYGNHHGKTTSRITGFATEHTLSGYSGGISATWYADEARRLGLYSDNWLQFSRFENHVKGDDLSAETWRSQGETAATEWGYRAAFSLSDQTQLLLQPQVQIAWMNVRASEHQEQSASSVQFTGDGNVATRVGVRVELQTSRLAPYVEANALHNSRAFGSQMDDRVVEIEGTKHIAEVKAGIRADLFSGLEIAVEGNAQQGTDHYRNLGGALTLLAHF
jgi:autotransporter family porin